MGKSKSASKMIYFKLVFFFTLFLLAQSQFDFGSLGDEDDEAEAETTTTTATVELPWARTSLMNVSAIEVITNITGNSFSFKINF